MQTHSQHKAHTDAPQAGLDSPKPRMEHGHPGSSIGSVSGGAEQKVLLDGHVADERQDEQRHAEHDQPQRAGDPHHPASLRTPAPPDRRITDRPGPGRGDSEHPGAPHQQQGEGVDAEAARVRSQSPWKEEARRGSGNAWAVYRRAETLKAWQANKDAQSAGLLTLLTEDMKPTESVCAAGVRSGQPRFYSRFHNLHMRHGGYDASAEETTQDERL